MFENLIAQWMARSQILKLKGHCLPTYWGCTWIFKMCLWTKGTSGVKFIYTVTGVTIVQRTLLTKSKDNILKAYITIFNFYTMRGYCNLEFHFLVNIFCIYGVIGQFCIIYFYILCCGWRKKFNEHYVMLNSARRSDNYVYCQIVLKS